MDDMRLTDKLPQFASNKQVLFSMRNSPLLEQGTTYDPLCATENMWVALKIYASGGENALHAHNGEDHAFIVMQGKATFHFGDGSTSVVEKFEGVMLPKGAQYRFEADTAENLVMLRVGAGVSNAKSVADLTRTGTPKSINVQTFEATGERKAERTVNKGESRKPRVFAPGKVFAPK